MFDGSEMHWLPAFIIEPHGSARQGSGQTAHWVALTGVTQPGWKQLHTYSPQVPLTGLQVLKGFFWVEQGSPSAQGFGHRRHVFPPRGVVQPGSLQLQVYAPQSYAVPVVCTQMLPGFPAEKQGLELTQVLRQRVQDCESELCRNAGLLQVQV